MEIFILAVGIVLTCIVLQRWELTKFRVREYCVKSSRIKEKACVAVLADLHGYCYGEGNRRLLEQVRACNPQAILIPGDMIVSKYSKTFPVALELLVKLREIAPVYYSFGNHESRLRDEGKLNHKAFCQYIKTAEKAGIHILNNKTETVLLGQNAVKLTGLELELSYYEKRKQISMDPGYLERKLGECGEDFHILLAHNPCYAPEYAEWGADVTFCGHNHGGLIRIPGLGSLLSPQITLFPKYDAGEFSFGKKRVIVSRGLGTHTVQIRVCNRAELLKVSLLPNNNS